MSQLKTHNLGFPGMLNKRYEIYRELLIAADKNARKAAKGARRGTAKHVPAIVIGD